MDEVETTVTFFKAIENKDWRSLEELLADDFRYYGPLPDPFDGKVWLQFQRAVQKAFPDWAYNIAKVEKQADTVHVKVHITGTHSEALELPWPGIPLIPPTGRKIEMPDEDAFVKVKEGKVKELRVEMQLHGGLPGLLEQLGLG